MLVRHHFLSLDPYMRGRMNDAKSYAVPQPLGQVMSGGTVGEVVESRSPKYQVGDKVVGMGGWQEYSVVERGPAGCAAQGRHHARAAVALPGRRRHARRHRLVWPGEDHRTQGGPDHGGERRHRAPWAARSAPWPRRVAAARSASRAAPDKCKYVKDELGFDACIDYKEHKDAASLSKALKEACPDGIDGYFENVGGMVLDAVLMRMNAFGRIALCGMIAGYDGQPVPMSYPQLLLTNRLKLQGFIVSEHMEVWPEALKELGTLVAHRQAEAPRDRSPRASSRRPRLSWACSRGKNFGKQLVKLI